MHRVNGTSIFQSSSELSGGVSVSQLPHILHSVLQSKQEPLGDRNSTEALRQRLVTEARRRLEEKALTEHVWDDRSGGEGEAGIPEEEQKKELARGRIPLRHIRQN